MRSTNIAEQQDVADFMRAYLAEEDCMPTLAEIAKHFGWKSANAAAERSARLVKQGVLERSPRGNLRFVRKAATA